MGEGGGRRIHRKKIDGIRGKTIRGACHLIHEADGHKLKISHKDALIQREGNKGKGRKGTKMKLATAYELRKNSKKKTREFKK